MRVGVDFAAWVHDHPVAVLEVTTVAVAPESTKVLALRWPGPDHPNGGSGA